MAIKPTNPNQPIQRLTQFIIDIFAGFKSDKNIPTNNHAKCGFILRNKLPLIEDQEQKKAR